jgi:hypothetical protein
MPALVRFFIKTALVYFVAALLIGLYQVLLPTLPESLQLPGLNPVYFHLLMVGWVTQLIVGVAYWMFPRYSKDSPRGPEWFGPAIWGLLNVGLVLRAIGEPMQAAGSPVIAGWLMAISAVLQVAAGWLIVAALWPRVKER